MELISKPIRPIIIEIWLELFCYLINVENMELFLKKKEQLITIRIIFGLYQSKIGSKLAPLMLFVR